MQLHITGLSTTYPNGVQALDDVTLSIPTGTVREVTPPDMAYLIDDMFERIVVYDNRAVSATAKAVAGGRYEVTFSVIAKKLVADELGKEKDAALNDLIDIGVLDEKGEPLLLERRRIDKENSSFTVTVDKKPATAGIDPMNKLIDRKPKDNTVAVTMGS